MSDETIDVNGIEATFLGRQIEGGDVIKRPLILLVHGGPHGIWHNYHTPMLWHQLKNMHAVHNINYIGSSGRGAKFAKKLCGNAREIIIKVVKDFIETFVSEGKDNESQIKVSSGSFGGFMALSMMRKYPDLFKSASIFNPITNGFSMWLGSSATTWLDAEFLGEMDRPQSFSHGLLTEESSAI